MRSSSVSVVYIVRLRIIFSKAALQKRGSMEPIEPPLDPPLYPYRLISVIDKLQVYILMQYLHFSMNEHMYQITCSVVARLSNHHQGLPQGLFSVCSYLLKPTGNHRKVYWAWFLKFCHIVSFHHLHSGFYSLEYTCY